ncbi:MAG: hypothetical protein HRT89_07120, partial [Lentisphaeria bacterium]|nr:hypothetical protein [Lentisphaeria bacterium]
MTNEKAYFEKRIGRFGRVRRAVANVTHVSAAGVAVLVIGIAALVLLCGWITNPFINIALALLGAVTGIVLLIRFLIRWERDRGTLSEAFHAEALASDLNSRLISAVDFLEQPEPAPLLKSVIEQARMDLDRPFERLLDRKRRNQLCMYFALLLVAFSLLGSTERFAFSRVADTVTMSALSLREALFPTRFELIPGPGEHIYQVGEEVELGIQFTRFAYPEVT